MVFLCKWFLTTAKNEALKREKHTQTHRASYFITKVIQTGMHPLIVLQFQVLHMCERLKLAVFAPNVAIMNSNLIN